VLIPSTDRLSNKLYYRCGRSDIAAGYGAAQPGSEEDVADLDTQQQDNRANDDAPTKRRGFKIVDMDLEDHFIQEMQNHRIACHRAMEKLKSRKKGFDIINKWECAFCHSTIDRQSSQNVRRVSSGGKRDPLASEINVLIAESAYENGVSETKGLKFLEGALISSPASNAWRKFRFKNQDAACEVSTEQLRANRREHVEACRAQHNYKGDLKFTDLDGKERSIARGPICGDGGGPTRAYNHRITGDQHGLVIFSALTGKPIYVEVDQTSCVYCNRLLTQYINLTHKNVQDILPDDISGKPWAYSPSFC
jgi:hypothetical protein